MLRIDRYSCAFGGWVEAVKSSYIFVSFCKRLSVTLRIIPQRAIPLSHHALIKPLLIICLYTI